MADIVGGDDIEQTIGGQMNDAIVRHEWKRCLICQTNASNASASHIVFTGMRKRPLRCHTNLAWSISLASIYLIEYQFINFN